MIPRMKPWILAALAALLLSACDSKPQPVEYKPLYFTQYQPIYMAVSSIEIVEEYKSPGRLPNVEHLVPYSPAEAMRIWVRDRLRTSGGDKTMQVIIKNGSIVHGSGDLYNARLEVELRVYGSRSVVSEASVFATATRGVTVPAGASGSQRNMIFRKMIGEMMDEFNAELEKNIFMFMGDYISYSQSP